MDKKQAKIKKLVKKGAFSKLRSNYLMTDEETQELLAVACADNKTDDSVNLVLALLDLGSDRVKIAALKTLAVIASDRVTSTLQLLYSKTPDTNTELRKTIIETVHTIKERMADAD